MSTGFKARKGVFKSKYNPRSKTSMFKTVESIVRNMGPPRNRGITNQLLIDGTANNVINSLVLGSCLIEMCANSSANATAGEFNMGAFPATGGSGTGAIGL